jgi:hypothetical protein
MKRWLGYTLLTFAVVSLAGGVVAAQKKQGSMQCGDSWNDDRLKNHCDIREQTLPAGGPIAVDAGTNGGVSVKGWDRNEILVRSRVQTSAPSQAEADQLATGVRIETGALQIHAEGPERREDFNWSVSYEVFAPRRSDLSLKAHNGGISINDVQGKIDFSTQNGGVSLRRVGGDVHGSTTNGGVNVELAGTQWDGGTLDVQTTNGGVNLMMPENYSAHLETSTVNGNVTTDFPMNVPLTDRGRLPKDISVDLGSGGPTVRAVTTNGGVRVTHSASAN